MENEKREGSITANKDIDKRVLVVGKLKGTKQPKKVETKKTTKAKTTKPKAKTSANAKTKQVVKKDINKVAKNTNKKAPAKKTAAKTTTKTTTKKQTEPKKSVVKNEKTSKTPENKNTKATATKGAKKVANKKEKNKIKIVEKIEKIVKDTTKNITKQKQGSKKKVSKKENKTETRPKTSKKATVTGKRPKVNITKKAIENISVLRVDIKSEEFKTIVRDIIIFIFVVALAISLIYIGNAGKQNVSNKMLYSSLSKDIKMEELTNNGKKPTDAIKTLKQENPEIQGWIKIEGTNVNYPLLQGKDNEYYLTHNFKNEKTNYGSIFVNTNCDLNNEKSNIIIYGHDMKDGQMFSDLIKYADKEYYNGHKTIKITTENSENEYTIVSAFKSKVFYKDEKNVFRFYQYYNLENEKQFKDYISNCKKLQLYNTGVEANYGEQLVTLITCEYSEENGRMVVVAKKN